MGYYTCFTLKVKPYDEKSEKKQPTASEIAKTMNEGFEKDEEFYPFSSSIEDLIDENSKATSFFMDCEDSAKWYEYDEEMTALSEKYPDTLFKLHGDGEETGDTWDVYYLGGKSAEYRPGPIPPFDPKDLK